jgi:hypothetical protein
MGMAFPTDILFNGSTEAFAALLDAECVECANCGTSYGLDYGSVAQREARARLCCWCPVCHRVKDHVGECFTTLDNGAVTCWVDSFDDVRGWVQEVTWTMLPIGFYRRP